MKIRIEVEINGKETIKTILKVIEVLASNGATINPEAIRKIIEALENEKVDY